MVRVTFYSVLCGSVCIGLIVLFEMMTYTPYTPVSRVEVAYPPDSFSISTDVWGIFDPETGVILAGNNTETVRPIASITKLFTAHTVLQSEAVDEPVTVVYQDVVTEGEAGKLEAGDKMTRRELLFPLLIESSNDAGAALRRSLGDTYASLLEETVADLSLSHTVITDPAGLDRGNTSTVHDIAAFTSYLRREEPYLFDITRLSMYVGEETGWINNNPVHDIPGFLGGKHGYTPEAGRTFVGVFRIDSIDRDVGVVILGSVSLRQDVTDLLEAIEERTS